MQERAKMRVTRQEQPTLETQGDHTIERQRIALSPTGKNELLRAIIENFCTYYTPGGTILYAHDADEERALFDRAELKRLGVTLDTHDWMPDVVIYMKDRNWLVLLEAASSHGPVDAKRHAELQTLFAGSTAGLVFVSCFPTRKEMRKYLDQIAWETEVWCADNPTHLIHFNGERFLGPYPSRTNEELDRQA